MFCWSGIWVFCIVFYDLLLIVFSGFLSLSLLIMLYHWNLSPSVDTYQDCDMCTITYEHHSMFQKGLFVCLNWVFFWYCILWFTVDVFSRIMSFCPCPSYFYFPIVFHAIHLIKCINRGIDKILTFVLIFHVSIDKNRNKT